MTPINVMVALKKRIQDIVKNYSFQQSNPDGQTEEGESLHPLREVKVHLQHLPNKMYDGQPDEADYPMVLIVLGGGSVGEDDRGPVNISIIAGGYDPENDNQGWLIPAEIIWRIVSDLKQDPIIDNRYPIQLPITWTIPDEQPAPQWLGSIELGFTLPIIGQAFQMQEWNTNPTLEDYSEIDTLPRRDI